MGYRSSNAHTECSEIMPPQYIAKYIDIMNRYFELPTLTSLRQNEIAMYNGKTPDITSAEQMALYATFNHKRKLLEQFVEIIPISKVFGTHISTRNVLSAFESYFQKLEVLFKNNTRFFMMDTANLNSSKRKCLKWLLKQLIPSTSWSGC